MSDCICLSRASNGIATRSQYTYIGWEYAQTGIPVASDDDGFRFQVTLASEAALKAIWDTAEEDEAWKDL